MVRELAVLNLALVFLAACGGDDDGGIVCEEFSACGGDPAGDWVFVDVCVDVEEITLGIEECPEATARFSNFNISGTVSFDPAGTYQVDQSVQATVVLTVPLSCFEGAIENCDEVSQLVELDCSASGDSCSCPDETDTDISDTGTWEVDGSSITLGPSGDDEPNVSEFCIDGDRMELRSPEIPVDVMSSQILERS
jgi:hypothetical protein